MEAALQALGAIIVALLTVIGSLVVARTSAKSAQRSGEKAIAGQIESSRIQAEQGAFDRAKSYYEAALDRQLTEISNLEEDIARQKDEIALLRRTAVRQDNELNRCRAVCRQLARRLGEPEPNLD